MSQEINVNTDQLRKVQSCLEQLADNANQRRKYLADEFSTAALKDTYELDTWWDPAAVLASKDACKLIDNRAHEVEQQYTKVQQEIEEIENALSDYAESIGVELENARINIGLDEIRQGARAVREVVMDFFD